MNKIKMMNLFFKKNKFKLNIKMKKKKKRF